MFFAREWGIVMSVQPIKVLVVDDSLFMRSTVANMLDRDQRITVVGSARTGEEAIEKIAELHPDVVTLDIEMPGMNGLEALKRIMARTPMPVIMVSSLTEEGAKETIEALELGAVDFLPKLTRGVSANLSVIQRELSMKVIVAAGTAAKIRKPVGGQSSTMPTRAPRTQAVTATRENRIIVIGCSTGGPKALEEVIPLFPNHFPAGILIVQHMPKLFTKSFAQRLNTHSQLEVREAVHGDIVAPGVVMVAPGGVQMRVALRKNLEVEIALASNNESLPHAPSVDILMESVAEVYSNRGIGVILTGMGQDGFNGMRAIKMAKGKTIVQDEATCIVYGMPKAVVDGGYADKVAPLSAIAGEVANMLSA